ncbi:hypothetical protein Kpol_1062p10 [Vanderwaltozyma polyspora DSM 70294]|uniref:Uncharacterized protein n=1 Tax=Vanderwaltozyma polyspora (strain ATCC 22028 / DSM 70294 / BCRC 21397 / CBS 2163 / NBRC 10782 / NRRL Y-8283 / UCD 57-17) TaxID=436907 RepID=A7TK68_VANPO|nr:uncharacterized protein Kpol_1062p10 [Vanderwaltozyma polyspora DSM 70294]EDO17303.1 hypothetical protein Kpol_1062p10 [Vanderwaltozyma polyspora DSM 70294]
MLVKDNIRSKREASFSTDATATGKKSGQSYYDNYAQIKPGFPLPKEHTENIDSEQSVSPVRKSKYEGAGNSYMSRKRGDKLGFLDRKNNE